MKRLKLSPSQLESDIWIDEAVKCLLSGGMIVYPTETCYGIGVEATNPEAVKRLIDFKGNRAGKAISVAVADVAMAKTYVEVNETAHNLYEKFLPGPVTVISRSKGLVAKALETAEGTLGIRLPDFTWTRKMIKRLGKPITATSANTSGKKPPYSFDDWQKYTTLPRRQMVDLFIDVGELPERQPSTVVDTTLNEAKVIRQGEMKVPTNAKVFGSHSVDETIEIGREIMCAYLPYLADKPVILALQGELGAGKTHLTKGVAKALGIKELVKSPTYTLVKEYAIPSTTGMLYHIDTWRLGGQQDLEELGFGQMLKQGNVIVVEWGQKISKKLREIEGVKAVWINLEDKGGVNREIRVFEDQKEGV